MARNTICGNNGAAFCVFASGVCALLAFLIAGIRKIKGVMAVGLFCREERWALSKAITRAQRAARKHCGDKSEFRFAQ